MKSRESFRLASLEYIARPYTQDVAGIVGHFNVRILK